MPMNIIFIIIIAIYYFKKILVAIMIIIVTFGAYYTHFPGCKDCHFEFITCISLAKDRQILLWKYLAILASQENMRNNTEQLL